MPVGLGDSHDGARTGHAAVRHFDAPGTPSAGSRPNPDM